MSFEFKQITKKNGMLAFASPFYTNRQQSGAFALYLSPRLTYMMIEDLRAKIKPEITRQEFKKLQEPDYMVPRNFCLIDIFESHIDVEPSDIDLSITYEDIKDIGFNSLKSAIQDNDQANAILKIKTPADKEARDPDETEILAIFAALSRMRLKDGNENHVMRRALRKGWDLWCEETENYNRFIKKDELIGAPVIPEQPITLSQ